MEAMALSSTLVSLSISLREAAQALSRLQHAASVNALNIKEMQLYTCTLLGREGFHFFGELLSFCSFTKIYPLLVPSVPRGTPWSSSDLSVLATVLPNGLLCTCNALSPGVNCVVDMHLGAHVVLRHVYFSQMYCMKNCCSLPGMLEFVISSKHSQLFFLE